MWVCRCPGVSVCLCACMSLCLCACVFSGRKSATRVDPIQPHVGFPTACRWIQPRSRSLLPLVPGFPVHCLPDFPGTPRSYGAAPRPPIVSAICRAVDAFLVPKAPCPPAASTAPYASKAIGTIGTPALPQGGRWCWSVSFSACCLWLCGPREKLCSVVDWPTCVCVSVCFLVREQRFAVNVHWPVCIRSSSACGCSDDVVEKLGKSRSTASFLPCFLHAARTPANSRSLVESRPVSVRAGSLRRTKNVQQIPYHCVRPPLSLPYPWFWPTGGSLVACRASGPTPLLRELERNTRGLTLDTLRSKRHQMALKATPYNQSLVYRTSHQVAGPIDGATSEGGKPLPSPLDPQRGERRQRSTGKPRRADPRTRTPVPKRMPHPTLREKWANLETM